MRGELGVERHRLECLLVLEQPPVGKLQGVRYNGEAVSHLGVQPRILGYLHRQVSLGLSDLGGGNGEGETSWGSSCVRLMVRNFFFTLERMDLPIAVAQYEY